MRHRSLPHRGDQADAVERHPVKPVPVFWEPAFWDMSEYQAPTNAPSNALGLAPATASRGGEPFGLSSPQPGRAVAAAPGRPAAVVPALLASRDGAAPATPACAIRTRPIASQAPPSRGWHVALHHPVPLQTLTSRENGLWRGRSPVGRSDLPGKRPLAWIVGGFKWGLST